MNRNTLLASVLILVAFATLIVTDYNRNVRFANPTDADPVRRWQIIELNYCSADHLKPCVVSFSRTATGMLINLTLPAASYPEFYLLITRGAEQLRYECQPVVEAPTSAWCTGVEILPGEVLHFTIVALTNNTILAEGNFTIIGLMLATPEVETVTPSATITPPLDVTPTELIFGTSTPTALSFETATPTALSFEPGSPTATDPAYPNPSYP